MSPVLVHSAAAVAVIAIGLHGLITAPSLLRKAVAFNICGGGIFLLLIALAARVPEGGPDPVPHAMVLTGIVVAVSVTALLVALARRLHAETGADALPEDQDGGGA